MIVFCTCLYDFLIPIRIVEDSVLWKAITVRNYPLESFLLIFDKYNDKGLVSKGP